MNEHIDWVEKAALENLRFHLESDQIIASRCSTTLAFLAAGGAGALSYATDDRISVIASIRPAFAMFSALLFGCAAVLIIGCMRLRPVLPPTNEPANLMRKDYSFEAIREGELNAIQQRIRGVTAANAAIASRLNRIVTAAVIGGGLVAAYAICVLLAGTRLYGSAPVVG